MIVLPGTESMRSGDYLKGKFKESLCYCGLSQQSVVQCE